MGLQTQFRNLVRPYYYGLRFATSRGVATLRVGGISARFHAASRREYQRVVGMTGEKLILAQFLRELAPGDVVFDIGANIGTHSVAFARVVGDAGKVVSFEPEPGTAQRLIDNVSLNQMENVDVRRFALGDAETTVKLYVDARSGSGQHSTRSRDDRGSIDVPVKVGDALVESGELPAPNVVKIDVEGAELGVIAGMMQSLSEPGCRLVFCEVHEEMLRQDGADPARVEEMLREAGFTEFTGTSRGPETHLIARKQPVV